MSISPLVGINEKLKRAEQNIINLNSEITEFLGEGQDQVFPKYDTDAFEKAVKAHGDREVPPRFPVLAGEIVHHLRCSLNYVVWLLSSEQYREEFPNRIEFPVCAVEPTSKDEIAKYNGKIEGISSRNAKAIIQSFQPYKRLEKGEIPEDDLLWIVHDLDRVDKHRELILICPGIASRTPPEFLFRYVKLKENTEASPADWEAFYRDMDVNSKYSPQICFRQFGKSEPIQAVIEGLTNLLNYIRNLIALFGGELK